MKLMITALTLSLTLAMIESKGLTYDGDAAEQVRHQNPGVLVELFTSEGCSSCPPADRVLSQLQETQPIPGVHVITLSEHVPYWNYLGWSDPYSADSFSERQSRYVAFFRSASVYTPQMIVDGKSEFVGSDYGKAVRDIRAAAAQTKVNINLSLLKSDNQVKVKGTVDIPDAVATDEPSVFAALVEDNLRSAVSRGENSGHILAHSSVVRQLTKIVTLGSKTIRFEKMFNIAPTWKQEDLRLVVFVQDARDLRILGAAETRLEGTNRQ